MSDQEQNLEQSNAVPDVNFEGVKLTIGNESEEGKATELTPISQSQTHPPPVVQKNDYDTNSESIDIRSGSIRGRESTSALPGIIQEGFYAGKQGRLEEAVNSCQNTVVDQNNDGKVQGVWLLTEVDHWDNEKEKLIILTEKTVLVVKYDFVSCKFKDFSRIPFSELNSVQKGQFEYPEKTLVVPRDGVGVRLYWGEGREMSFLEKWNPFAADIPFLTLTSHPLEHSGEQPTSYQVDVFLNSLVQAVNGFRQQRNASSTSLPMKEAPIPTEILIGWHSAIYNQSRLGFSRERGGISF